MLDVYRAVVLLYNVCFACVHTHTPLTMTDDDKDVALQTDVVEMAGATICGWRDVVKQMTGHWFSHGVLGATADCNYVMLFIRSEGTSQ